MIPSGKSLLLFFVVLWSIFQAGCAARLPSAIPVAEERKETVLTRYRSFRQNQCDTPIDADISLEVRTFGKNVKTSGFLQMLQPSRLRLTIIDQIGRPVLILNAVDDSFVLANIMKGEAMIGSATAFLRESSEFPELGVKDVTELLTGRFSPPVSSMTAMRQNTENTELVWLVFPADAENMHNIVFDPDAARILRHVITDDGGAILLDIEYGRVEEIFDPCALADTLIIKGAALDGEVHLRYDRIMLRPEMPEDTFDFTLPEHFIIRDLEEVSREP